MQLNWPRLRGAGIPESGNPGIRESGIWESKSPGIQESGGIREKTPAADLQLGGRGLSNGMAFFRQAATELAQSL